LVATSSPQLQQKLVIWLLLHFVVEEEAMLVPGGEGLEHLQVIIVTQHNVQIAMALYEPTVRFGVLLTFG
jgi:hypothetical protein